MLMAEQCLVAHDGGTRFHVSGSRIGWCWWDYAMTDGHGTPCPTQLNHIKITMKRIKELMLFGFRG